MTWEVEPSVTGANKFNYGGRGIRSRVCVACKRASWNSLGTVMKVSLISDKYRQKYLQSKVHICSMKGWPCYRDGLYKTL